MPAFLCRVFVGAVLVVGLVGLAGCSSRSGKIPITGTLTVDGAPGSLATLTFWPSDPNTTGGAVFTDDNGNFVSGDAKADTGFLPGEYKVTVSRFLDSQGRPALVSGKKSEAAFEAPAKESIPADYHNQSTTPLSIRVAPDSTTFPLEVKTKK